MDTIILKSVTHGLDRTDHLINIVARHADPSRLLQAKLTDDMMPLNAQISIAIGFTLRTVLPLCGREEIDLGIAESLEALREMSQRARAILDEIAASDFVMIDKAISHIAGFADISQAPTDYVSEFGLPNMWFHLSMAYAILRMNVEGMSKGDFDGLHEYPDGFSF